MDDSRKAAEVATEHLINLGHTRVAFITGSDEYALSGARRGGYKAALTKHGLPVDEALIGRGDFTYESGVERRDPVRPGPARHRDRGQQQPDGAGRAAVAGRHDLLVPEQMSIVSFDDTPIVRFSRPPLTVVQPIAAMTAEAASC